MPAQIVWGLRASAARSPSPRWQFVLRAECYDPGRTGPQDESHRCPQDRHCANSKLFPSSPKGGKQVFLALECHQCPLTEGDTPFPLPNTRWGSVVLVGRMSSPLILKLPTTQWHFALITRTPKSVLEGLACRFPKGADSMGLGGGLGVP